MLVIGPSAQSVTVPAGSRRSVSTMKSTACCDPASIRGAGRSGPFRPVSPWTSSAVTSGRRSGAAAPAWTGTSVRPASSQIFSALQVVSGSGTLPATVQTPRTSISGLAKAVRIAMASSWPGSVSMMMRWFIVLASAGRSRLVRRGPKPPRAGVGTPPAAATVSRRAAKGKGRRRRPLRPPQALTSWPRTSFS